MNLIIAEKTSVAMSLAAVLGPPERKESYLEGSDGLVSWRIVHLLDLVPKDNRFFTGKKKTITPSVATALLKKGRIFMSGLYSEKTRKTYDAEILFNDTGGRYVNFKLGSPEKKGRLK